MSKHRAEVRPRWGRIGLSAGAGVVVLVALLAAVGILHGRDETAYDPAAQVAAGAATPTSSSSPSDGSTAAPSTQADAPDESNATNQARKLAGAATADTSLPADSGEGRRAVYSISRQRVWIVGDDDEVERTYPVSGSVEDNLETGTYTVYSRSRWASGIDDSGVMQYFVRFAHGTDQGAAIGFHSIPTKDGKALQTVAQLGTPQSHGCIRQKTADAIAMWDFAQIGTTVVVTA